MRTAWTLGLVLSSPHTFHIFHIPRILIKIQNISCTYQHHKQKMIKVVQLANLDTAYDAYKHHEKLANTDVNDP